ncbi:MAG: hypothetical protein AB1630_11480 [bacterium]
MSEKTETKDENTSLIGLRFYKYFSFYPSRIKKLFYYFGAELDYFQYEDKKDKFTTDGFVGGGFAGVEKFLARKFSVNLDLGPYYAYTTKSGTSVGLVDFVMNLSINYYFGGLK